MQQLQNLNLAKNVSKIVPQSLQGSPRRRGFTFYSEKSLEGDQPGETGMLLPTTVQPAESVNTATHSDGEIQVFANNQSFPMTIAQVGQVGKIAWFRGGRQRSFLEMGLIPGTEFQVLSRKSSGSAIIAIGDRQVGLGRGLTQYIMVTALN
jgi:Fe2+ transport system protein FeoA